MESFLKCISCEKTFNSQDRIPKVLPCSDVICSNCLKHKSQFILGEYVYKCKKCNKTQKLSSLDDIPTSNLTLHLINANSKNVTNTSINSSFQKHNLNSKLEIYEINKHYDNIINSIDIRTESLISFLCTSRQTLLDQVNEYRKKSISQFENKNNNEINKLKSLVEDGLNKIESKNTTIDKKTVRDLISNYDKLESLKYDIKKKLWYFDENCIKNDKSMIGYILNKNLDRNYAKIKYLNEYLKGNDFYDEQPCSNPNSVKVQLVSPNNFIDISIRQHVLPLSRNKIVKVYFTTKRALYVESFDFNGKYITSNKAFENLSSFPISYAYGDYFCLSFTAKSTPSVSIFDSNQCYVLLFNSDLKCIKVITKFTSIESLFMNEKNIFIFYAHKTSPCCEILDYDLNEIESIGQQIDPEKGYFMEKTKLAWKEQNSSGLKNNPKIFGCTDSFIYLFNINQMIIMDRKTGKIVRKHESNGDPAYYLLDSQENIIKVNNLCKRISLMNFDQEINIQNRYLDCLEDVYLTIDDHLAFVDKNKEYVIFV